MQTVVLEPSTNTHVMTFGQIMNEQQDTFLAVKAQPNRSTVLHGEHGPIGIESENILKFNQQEFNPVSKAFQKVFD